MLVSIEIYTDEGNNTVGLNPFHVISIMAENPRNPDGGTIILLRTGIEYFSPEPVDKIRQRIDERMNTVAAQLSVQIITEYATPVKKPVKRAARTKKA